MQIQMFADSELSFCSLFLLHFKSNDTNQFWERKSNPQIAKSFVYGKRVRKNEHKYWKRIQHTNNKQHLYRSSTMSWGSDVNWPQRVRNYQTYQNVKEEANGANKAKRRSKRKKRKKPSHNRITLSMHHEPTDLVPSNRMTGLIHSLNCVAVFCWLIYAHWTCL